jgi:hypothetical protein
VDDSEDDRTIELERQKELETAKATISKLQADLEQQARSDIAGLTERNSSEQ